MKTRIYVLAILIAAAAASCNRVSDNPANTTSGSNSSNAAVGTAQQATSETPTPAPSARSEETKAVTVRFPTGATEASYTDSFSGYGTIDYKFDAKARQQLTAEITSSDDNKAVLSVMRNGAAIADDASTVQGWTGELPANGSYVVRVGQMRNDARRGDKAVKFGVRISIID